MNKGARVHGCTGAKGAGCQGAGCEGAGCEGGWCKWWGRAVEACEWCAASEAPAGPLRAGRIAPRIKGCPSAR